MSTGKVGQAKYGSNFTQRKYFKMKDGSVTFRILPPIGDLADDGRWSVFYKVHYGYRTTDGKMKTFVSPLVKNKKTGMVEVPDAALERIEKLKVELAKAIETKNEKLVDMLKTFVGQKGMYNLDSNHYLNVIDQEGNIGVLKIRHRAKSALDAEIKRLVSEGVDPLSIENGRFFTFTRSGMGLDTTFKVEVLSKQLNVAGVGTVKQEVVHVLDAATIARLGNEAAELDKLFRRPTSEEVAQIVKLSDLKTGQSKGIDELFAKNEDNSVDEGEDESDEATVLNQITAATSGTTAATQTVTAPAQNVGVVTPAATKPQATNPVAAVTTTPASTVTTTTTPATTPVATKVETTVEQINNMSADDFIASLGLNL